MAWELVWTKPRAQPPIQEEEALAPNETPKTQTKNVSQNQGFYRLAHLQRHKKVRPSSAQIKRKPVPSSYKPSKSPQSREVRKKPTARTYKNPAPALESKVLLRTDSYIISSIPKNKIPQNGPAETREGVPTSHDGHNACCKQCSKPLDHALLDDIRISLSPVLAALDATADDLEYEDLSLSPSTPLEFAQFPFSRKGSFDTSMMSLIQPHPDTPIGGYEAAPMAIIYPVPIRRTTSTGRRYETPRIEISPPEHTYSKEYRQQLRSSSSYEYQNYEALVDGNISHSQSSNSSGNTYCCDLGKKERPQTPVSHRDSCFAIECPTHVEKWITTIPRTDGANTPPLPLTSISDPPITTIHHSTSPPTAPLPVPIETPAPAADAGPSVPVVPATDLPDTSKLEKATEKAMKTLTKRKKAKQGLRKFRKVLFRKSILGVVLGRQLAQPTADLLKLVADGIPFDPPDVMALAKPLGDAPVPVPVDALPVDAVPTDAVPTGAVPTGPLPV